MSFVKATGPPQLEPCNVQIGRHSRFSNSPFIHGPSTRWSIFAGKPLLPHPVWPSWRRDAENSMYYTADTHISGQPRRPFCSVLKCLPRRVEGKWRSSPSWRCLQCFQPPKITAMNRRRHVHRPFADQQSFRTYQSTHWSRIIPMRAQYHCGRGTRSFTYDISSCSVFVSAHVLVAG